MTGLGGFADPQPAPEPRYAGVSLHTVAAALHARRRDVGLETYGTALTTHNGRTAGVDLVQELADGLVYAIQGTLEHRALLEVVAEFRDRLVDHGETLLEEFDEMFSPAALTARTDRMARSIVDEMVDGS